MSTDMWSNWPWYYYIPGTLIILLAVLSAMTAHPVKMLSWVNYLSGTLGTGKTSFVALISTYLYERGIPYYATFELFGAIPFDLSTDDWPEDEGCWIFIDETLLMKSVDFLPDDKMGVGCTLARQNNQHLVLIGQGHRPSFNKKYWGTIGLWLHVSGFTWFRAGRVIQMRRSEDPFNRTRGFRNHSMKRSFHFIPAAVFSLYNSRRIFGLTVDKEGNKIKWQFQDKKSDKRKIAYLSVDERSVEIDDVPELPGVVGVPGAPGARGLNRYDW